MSETTIDERIRLINRQFRTYRRVFFIALAVGVIVNVALYFTATGPERPGKTLMEIELTQPWVTPVLCPGDTVNIEYTVHIREPGVFHMDRSLWRVTPPQTLVFSRTEIGVYPARIDFLSQREWLIPPSIINPVDGKPMTLAPGQYEFRWAMTTSSRSTVPSILVVPFQLRQGCP